MTKDKRDAIAARLAKIAAEAGGLTADRVLMDAKRPNSPLHSEFEWDDSIAADQFRVEQARALIRSVRVVVEVRDHEITIPKYVHDPRDSGSQGYVSTTSLASDESLALCAIRAEVDRAMGSIERARAIAAALGMSEAAERMIAAIVRHDPKERTLPANLA